MTKIIKPNITEGEWNWVIDDESMARLINENDEHVLSVSPCKSCRVKIKETRSFFGQCYLPTEETAKAISAVPVMIDELLIQRRVLFMQLESLDWLEKQKSDIGNWVQNQRDIINARIKCNRRILLKAGCTEVEDE